MGLFASLGERTFPNEGISSGGFSNHEPVSQETGRDSSSLSESIDQEDTANILAVSGGRDAELRLEKGGEGAEAGIAELETDLGDVLVTKSETSARLFEAKFLVEAVGRGSEGVGEGSVEVERGHRGGAGCLFKQNGGRSGTR